MMLLHTKIVAVIPAYNEGTHITDVIRGARAYVNTVIVVDDGSSDDTTERARAAGATIITHALNCGAGAATMTGIRAARSLGAEIIITLDADGQHNPDDIPRLLQPVTDNQADVVIGSRFLSKNSSIPLVRRLFNAMGNIFTFVVTGRYVSDSQSGFKVFANDAAKKVHLHLGGYEFCTEIIREIHQNKWRVVEIPIRVVYSAYTLAKGQSFSRGVITACKILLRSFLR